VGEATLVCHKADEMRRSVDRSLALIGKIDILQIHKASVEVLSQHDVTSVIQHAANLKITSYGASVSDLPAARLAIETGLFDWLQFPFSATNPQFSEVFVALAGAGIRVFVNRPLAMGKLAGADQIERAFSFIQSSDLPAGSIVLTGTGVPLHLHENVNAFARAKA
jgi:aryl-alcohol dehydrogenase-like predicted oxidoreductase